MDCRSKVVSSSLTINVTVIAQATIQLEQHPSNRHGAEEARGAHNSEDLGSKPSAGIFYPLFALFALLISPYPTHFPFSRFLVGWRVSKRIHPVHIPTNGWVVVKCLFCCYFFSVEWLFSLFVLVQLLKCCAHRA